MPLIDASYFHGEIHIAQKSQVEVLENINDLIEKYEPIFLKKLLGREMYAEFTVGLGASEIEEKWLQLRDGINDDWMGLINDEKKSPIANFVYYHWQAMENLQTVGIGVVKPMAENAYIASPVQMQVRAWNEMVDWIIDLHTFMDKNYEVYTNYAWREYNDILGYMDYECGKRIKFPFQKINRFGL